MNIDELTDQEKSRLLIRMLKNDMLPNRYLPIDSPEFKPIDLYNPANMALAWRVLNWAKEQKDKGVLDTPITYWWGDFEAWMKISPADAQRLWLDQILTLAIEAGLDEVK